jgi:hypothetical protein
MGTARDTQRSKVYAWEGTFTDRFTSTVSQPSATKLVRQMYGWHTTANISKDWGAPSVIFNARGVRSWASYGNTKIKLLTPYAPASKDVHLWDVAHEVAHCLTPNRACSKTGGVHGKLFMRHFIEILIRFKVVDMSLSELEASAKAAGVKVAPRTRSLRVKRNR